MNWFAEWFNTPYYHILYKNRNEEEAKNFISHLVESLSLVKDNKLLDLACGKGRHSIFLNKLGYNVVGVDLATESIASAKEYENDRLKFYVRDMREALFPNTFTAVFSLFTSFGYFNEDEENLKVFNAVYNQLKEKGVFVMDFMNVVLVENTLIEKEVKVEEGIEFHLARKIEDGFIIKDINFTDKGKEFYYQERVKICKLDYFEKCATAVGFTLKTVFGDYNLQKFDESVSQRLIMVFEKK